MAQSHPLAALSHLVKVLEIAVQDSNPCVNVSTFSCAKVVFSLADFSQDLRIFEDNANVLPIYRLNSFDHARYNAIILRPFTVERATANHGRSCVLPHASDLLRFVSGMAVDYGHLPVFYGRRCIRDIASDGSIVLADKASTASATISALVPPFQERLPRALKDAHLMDLAGLSDHVISSGLSAYFPRRCPVRLVLYRAEGSLLTMDEVNLYKPHLVPCAKLRGTGCKAGVRIVSLDQ
ncbi:hypothetical protein [Mollivirus kamchatka]|nr:hypothetical protein [Mollivirus kamchatka]